MIKTSYQVPELRNADDEVVQEGAFGKNTALSNSQNDGWIDYVMNDLEALHDVIGDSAATLDGNGHVVEPCNLAIGDEDGNRIKTNYLKLSGGYVAGALSVKQSLKMQDNQENIFGGLYVPASSASSQFVQFYGGETPATTGTARLTLRSDEDNHSFTLTAGSTDGSTDYSLVGNGNGTLTWRGNELAPLASPAFTGNPTAPTQSTNNSSTRLATTAYVVNDLKSNSMLLADALVDTIPSEADLDDYTTPGTYRSVSSTVTGTIANTPRAGSAFKLVVMQIGYGTSSYAMQLWFGSGRFFYIRSRVGTTSWNDWRQVAFAESSLQLSGGTMTGTVIEEMAKPSTRNAYRINYTDITNGTIPTSTSYGYLLIAYDGQETPSPLAGISYNINSNNWTSTRLHNNWGGTSRYVEVLSNGSDTFSFRFGADNSANLGGSSYRWKQLFAGTTTISTSDERLKTNITDIPNEVLDAWGEVQWQQFNFLDAWQEKGDRARIHTGTIAQRIKAVFESHNLDPFRYGLLCYDEWGATPAERDEDGNITTPAQPAGNRYSLRYEEALCMEAAYQRRRADRLEARIEALERAIS